MNVPNMAYSIGMGSLFVSVVTDDMLVIRISDQTAIFIDVATGMMLRNCYVPSLVSLFHRPKFMSFFDIIVMSLCC